MKILPVNTYNYSHKNITKSNKSEYNTNNSAVRNPINTYQLGYYTYGINFGKLKSDKINYADTKEFSKYLHSKIEEKSITYKPEDIDIMISDVQDRTGAKEETVREVFARLVQFSTNSQLKAFEDALAENGIFEIREANNNLSTNNLLMYISKVKDQICPMKKRDEESERPFSLRYGRKHTDLNQTDERKSKAIILDDRVLDFYEKKKEDKQFFQDKDIKEI